MFVEIANTEQGHELTHHDGLRPHRLGQIGAVLAAIGASLCCVAPLVLLSIGVGGPWMSSLTALEPYRPIFVLVTAVLLGFAGWRLYRRAAPTIARPARPAPIRRSSAATA